ncbi:hypothetical protein EV182_008610, partial [Spiromyces aspiralis]
LGILFFGLLLLNTRNVVIQVVSEKYEVKRRDFERKRVHWFKKARIEQIKQRLSSRPQPMWRKFKANVLTKVLRPQGHYIPDRLMSVHSHLHFPTFGSHTEKARGKDVSGENAATQVVTEGVSREVDGKTCGGYKPVPQDTLPAHDLPPVNRVVASMERQPHERWMPQRGIAEYTDSSDITGSSNSNPELAFRNPFEVDSRANV